MPTVSEVFALLTALLFMGAALGILAVLEYRAQQRQHADQHRAVLRRVDALGAVVVGEVRRAPASPASVRREIDEAEAALSVDEEKPPAAPPDDRPQPAAGGAS